MKEGALMLHRDHLEATLAKWIEPHYVDQARQEIVFAFVEFEEMSEAGTAREREIAAADNLAAIATAARTLCLKLDTMPPRAAWALLDHRNATRQPDPIGRWLADLRVIREDVLGPLANDAAEALKHLPVAPGRGRPGKTGPAPREALLLRLAALHASSGLAVESRGEPPLHGFLRDAVESVGMKLPDDLARILRDAEGKSAGI